MAGAVLMGESVPTAPLTEGKAAEGVASVGELLLSRVADAASEAEAQADSVGGARLAVPAVDWVPLLLDSKERVETGDKDPGARVALLPKEAEGSSVREGALWEPLDSGVSLKSGVAVAGVEGVASAVGVKMAAVALTDALGVSEGVRVTAMGEAEEEGVAVAGA